MKRIQIIFSCTILVLITFLGYLYEVRSDTIKWKMWANDFNSTSFYLYRENIKNFSDKDISDILYKVADEYKVSVIKDSYSSNNDKVTIIKGIIQNTELPQLKLKNNSKINNFDFSKEQYSTKTNVKDYFNDDIVNFEILSSVIHSYGGNGEYLVISENYSNREAFLNKLSKELDMDLSALTTKKRFEQTGYSTQFYVLAILFGIFILIYSITNVFVMTKQSKEISVLKLNGYNTFNIFFQLMKSSVLSIILTSILITIIASIFIKEISPNYYILIIFIMLLVISINVIFSGITYIYLVKQSLSSLIKGKKNLRVITIVSKVFQTLFIILASYSLVLTMSIVTDLFIQNKYIDNWKNYNNYNFVGSTYIGNDIQSIRGNNNKLSKDFVKFYNFLEENGAEYFKVDDLISSDGKSIGVSAIDVNENYLKNNNIQFEELFLDSTQYLLIPKDKEHLIKEIEKVKENYYKSMNEHLQMIDEPKIIENIKTIVYDKNITVPNLMDGGVIKNPILNVKTSENISMIDKSNAQISGLKTPIKFKNISKEMVTNYLDNSELKDNKIKIVSVEQWFINERTNLLTSLYLACFFAILIIISMLFVSFQEALISFENRKKDLAIKKLNGYDVIARHGTRLLVDLGIFFISISFCIVTLLKQINIYTFILLFVLFFIYLISEYIIILKDEKAILNIVIKGE